MPTSSSAKLCFTAPNYDSHKRQSLVLVTASQGNREPKAPSAPRELMETFITEQFETPRHMPAASVYRAYEQECRKRNLTALSARAFYQRIKQRATPEQTEAREGARAAYPEQPWFWEVTAQTPRHGSRPFEVPISIIPNWTSRSAVPRPASCWASPGSRS